MQSAKQFGQILPGPTMVVFLCVGGGGGGEGGGVWREKRGSGSSYLKNCRRQFWPASSPLPSRDTCRGRVAKALMTKEAAQASLNNVGRVRPGTAAGRQWSSHLCSSPWHQLRSKHCLLQMGSANKGKLPQLLALAEQLSSSISREPTYEENTVNHALLVPRYATLRGPRRALLAPWVDVCQTIILILDTFSSGFESIMSCDVSSQRGHMLML